MTDPYRLLGQLPRWLHANAPLAKRLNADWLAEGFHNTANKLHTNGPTAWATRTTWAARGYPASTSNDHTNTNPDPHPLGISDRTGDAATRTTRNDPLQTYVDAITGTASTLIIWRHQPTTRTVTATLIARIDRLEHLTTTAIPARPNTTTRRRLNLTADPGCQHCQRYGHWSPPTTDHPSTVNGNLAEPMLLCRWCRDNVRRHGTLPTAKHHEAWRTGDQSTIRRINSQLQTRITNRDGR